MSQNFKTYIEYRNFVIAKQLANPFDNRNIVQLRRAAHSSHHERLNNRGIPRRKNGGRLGLRKRLSLTSIGYGVVN